MNPKKRNKAMNKPSFTSENVPAVYRTAADYISVPSVEERIRKAEAMMKEYLAKCSTIADIDISVIMRAIKADEPAILAAIAAQEPSHKFNYAIIATEHEAELTWARSEIAKYDNLISKLDTEIDKLQHLHNIFN